MRSKTNELDWIFTCRWYFSLPNREPNSVPHSVLPSQTVHSEYTTSLEKKTLSRIEQNTWIEFTSRDFKVKFGGKSKLILGLICIRMWATSAKCQVRRRNSQLCPQFANKYHSRHNRSSAKTWLRASRSRKKRISRVTLRQQQSKSSARRSNTMHCPASPIHFSAIAPSRRWLRSNRISLLCPMVSVCAA